jgi:hypothetical protein
VHDIDQWSRDIATVIEGGRLTPKTGRATRGEEISGVICSPWAARPVHTNKHPGDAPGQVWCTKEREAVRLLPFLGCVTPVFQLGAVNMYRARTPGHTCPRIA